MKLMDLSGTDDFKEACGNLWQQVRSDYGCDLVVSIAQGGVYVSEAMMLPGSITQEYVRCQRPSTFWKGFLQPLIKLIPGRIKDALRKLEASFRARKHRKRKQDDPHRSEKRQVLYGHSFEEAVRKASTILIVDDAIDTGTTAVAVKRQIHNINRMAKIRIAVLTTTMDNPLISPDYVLYEQTLIRFPWSSDA
ncbi:phosphoribosyltransferase family protein [Marinobacteraceae bacterium S3BR75-40.1]